MSHMNDTFETFSADTHDGVVGGLEYGGQLALTLTKPDSIQFGGATSKAAFFFINSDGLGLNPRSGTLAVDGVVYTLTCQHHSHVSDLVTYA